MVAPPAVARFTAVNGLPDDWDRRAAPSAPTLRASWIRLVEGRLGAPLRTFALHDGGDRLGVALCGTVLSAPGVNRRMDPYMMLTGQSRDDGLLPDGPHPWLGIPIEDLFPCLLLMFPNYETAPAGYQARVPAALAEFIAALTDWAADSGVRSLAATYLRPDCGELLDVLRAEGWLVAIMTQRCDTDVVWRDFDGYLAGFPSKRRIVIRRELRALAELDVELGERRLAAVDERELLALRCQLVGKYGGRPDAAKEAGLLDRLRAEFDAKDLLVVEAHRERRLLGFTLFVRDGEHWPALMTGSDYTNPAARLSYFATCYYRPAALAPGLGIRTISYGMGSWQAKKLRGCRLRPVHVAARRIDRGR